MRWIVGLDLRPTGLGAIQMVRWMSEHAAEGHEPRFVGVHVIPRSARAAVREDVVDELCGKAADKAREVLSELGVLDAFERVEAVSGSDPDETLEAATRYYDADGLIIGRHGPREQESLVRLGKIARRLIRKLPAALMVVPPEIRPEDVGSGPVIAATDLGQSSIAAARFGLAFARDFSRDLTVMHARAGRHHAVSELDLDLTPLLEQPEPAEEPGALERWMLTYGLGGATERVEYGDPVRAMARLAESEDATLLVVGSRHLSLSERLFVASTGTDLARETKGPVLIVPPESLPRAPG